MGSDTPKAASAMAPQAAPRHVIKILGKGCGSCIWTERLVREVVAAVGADIEIVKLTKRRELERYGVGLTPAIVVDERVLCTGRIPLKEEIERWVRELLP